MGVMDGAGSWQLTSEGDRLVACFVGYLSQEAGAEAARAFVEALADTQVVAVFDIRQMTGYASGARREWTAMLKPRRSQLKRIELIGGNPIVRMGGSVMGALVGVPVVPVTPED